MAGEGAPVLVAGAGIAGLAAALALARGGREVVVAERAERLEAVGAGIQLSPNAGHVIAALGLDGLVDARAFAPEALVVHAGRRGRPVAEIPYAGSAARYGAPYRTIHRGDLQAAMLEAVADEPRVELRLSAPIERIEAAGAGAVAVLASGERIEAPLVVGADGVRSAVRAAVPDHAAPRYAGSVAWRGTAPAGSAVRGADPARPVTRLCLTPEAHVVAYPMGGGRGVNLVAVTRAARPQAAAPPGEGRLSGHPWQGLLEAADGWRPWPLFEVDPSGPMAAGPVVLIGDAGHAMVPFIAQGGGMALEDAASLAAAVARHGAGPAAAAAFVADRRPRLARVFSEARRTGRIYHLAGPLGFARDRAMAALGPERLLSRLDWLYGWRPPAAAA